MFAVKLSILRSSIKNRFGYWMWNVYLLFALLLILNRFNFHFKADINRIVKYVSIGLFDRGNDELKESLFICKKRKCKMIS